MNSLGYATLLVQLIPKEGYWRPFQIILLPMPTPASFSERETLLFTLGQPQPAAGRLPELPVESERGSLARTHYFDGWYQTPAALQAQLTDHQAVLWRAAGERTWALSSRAATVLLPTHAGSGAPLDFVTVRPAKGGGYLALHVGTLVFYDDYRSLVLPQLLAEIVARTAVKVNYLESHDC